MFNVIMKFMESKIENGGFLHLEKENFFMHGFFLCIQIFVKKKHNIYVYAFN
jgi:hypothetical protein